MNKTIYNILLLASLPTLASAQTVVNGSFEDGSGMTFSSGTRGDFYSGTPAGWTFSPDPTKAGSSVVNLIKSDYILSPAGVTGDYYLEAGNARHAGTLSQVVSGFKLGQSYRLSFDWGNREDSNSLRNAYDFDITIAGQSFSRKGDASEGITNMSAASIFFKATSISETISIVMNDPSDGNNSATMGAFDDFQITQVPEPSSTALLGLGALGLMLRRNR